jgi:DNA polymerase V
VVPLRRPTADTGLLVQAAKAGMIAIYRPGFRMAKAGVMLLELQPEGRVQGELALEEARTEAPERSSQLMSALDQVNRKFGKGTLKVASAGLEGDRREWEMKQERRTPRYTTDWGDVPVVRAS